MNIKDIIQECKKYNFDFASNVINITKIDSNVIFEVENVRTGKPEKNNKQDN